MQYVSKYCQVVCFQELMQLAHILFNFHVFFMLQSTEIEFSSVCFFDRIESRGQIWKIKLSKVGLFCSGSSLSLTQKVFLASEMYQNYKSALCVTFM